MLMKLLKLYRNRMSRVRLRKRNWRGPFWYFDYLHQPTKVRTVEIRRRMEVRGLYHSFEEREGASGKWNFEWTSELEDKLFTILGGFLRFFWTFDPD
jgi:hypothetical protein